MKPMRLHELLVPYEVRFIPNDAQRYNTPGDYYLNDNGVLVIVISQLPDVRESFAILLHEMTELALLMEHNPDLTLQQIVDMIDEFDNAYEAEADRAGGDDSEPGEDPRAPYYNEHQAATKAERAYIDALGIDWDEYDARVQKLREMYQQG